MVLCHVLHTRPFTGKQLRALFFCWLTLQGHVLGSPLVNGGAKSGIRGPGEPHENAIFAAPNKVPSSRPSAELYREGAAQNALDTIDGPKKEERQLQDQTAPYFFFTTPPYVNIVVFDSHDSNCDVNFESPPVTDPNLVGYPADGTDSLRQAHMACGVAPARFVFTTSDLSAYEDETIQAKMQIRITCNRAFFVESPTCENVLDATGDFPRIEECRFNEHEARLILQTRLKKQSTYSLTLKLLLPAGRMTAAENSYVFTTEFDPDDIIEGTKSSIDLGYTVPHAKDPTYGNDFTSRGYITGFFWQPTLTYESSPDVITVFTFGLRTFGFMNTDYNIDVVAHPTNVWKIGIPGTDCDQFTPPHIGTTCRLRSFQGALASEANGFRLDVGTTPMINLGSQATPQFSLVIRNPPSSVNMYWTATSFRIDEDQLPQEPFTVFIDKPISVMGMPTGQIVAFERGDVNVEQWASAASGPKVTGKALRVHVRCVEFESFGYTPGLFETSGFRVMLHAGRAAIRWIEGQPASARREMKYSRAVASDGRYSARLTCDFHEDLEVQVPHGHEMLSVDLWLETRSFVEQLDSLLDMVGLGNNLPEFSHIFLGRVIANLPPEDVEAVVQSYPVKVDQCEGPRPKAMSLGMCWA